MKSLLLVLAITTLALTQTCDPYAIANFFADIQFGYFVDYIPSTSSSSVNLRLGKPFTNFGACMTVKFGNSTNSGTLASSASQQVGSSVSYPQGSTLLTSIVTLAQIKQEGGWCTKQVNERQIVYQCNFTWSFFQPSDTVNPIVVVYTPYFFAVNTQTNTVIAFKSGAKTYVTSVAVKEVTPQYSSVICNDLTCATVSTKTSYIYTDLIYVNVSLTETEYKTKYYVIYDSGRFRCGNLDVALVTSKIRQTTLGGFVVETRVIGVSGTSTCTISLTGKISETAGLNSGLRRLLQTNTGVVTSVEATTSAFAFSGASILQMGLALLGVLGILLI